MAIQHLTDDEIRDWNLEKKDRWWLENVYKGNMPQLTFRSAWTGMIIGGILSITNLYVGIKTGWTLGIGITSVILAFSFFKLLSRFKLSSEITLLENNAMQSIATSAGYMTAPLVSSMSAYMLVTNQVVPMWQTFVWIIMLSLLGVLFAFPLKKRFINDEQLPFPEGRAAGIVMDGLHTGEGKDGIFKARILMAGALLSAFIETIRNAKIMEAMQLKWATIPEYWDNFIYKYYTPAILNTPLKDLTVRCETSIVMFATGGLMGIKTGVSMLIGACINYLILAPIMLEQGIIPKATFKNISMWSLWGGVAMMTTSSLFAFFAKPQILISAFSGLFKGKNKQQDILKDIELPMYIFAIGIPIMGAAVVIFGHFFFGIEYWIGLIAIPLVFVFTLIAVNSTGLTAITPGGALGKLTQLTFGIIAPGNIKANIMTAGINGEVALNASNLLMDIKPGYMLGAKPRQQAIGHVLGIFAGAIVAVPVFYLLFQSDVSMLTSEKLPMPSAVIWRAVADVLAKGLGFLHPSAQVAVLIGAVLGIVFEICNKVMKGKFPLSAMGFGLAFVLQFTNSFSMAMGAIFFWFMKRIMQTKKPGTAYKIFVNNQETTCAGVIAGGSIIGIVLMIIEILVIGK